MVSSGLSLCRTSCSVVLGKDNTNQLSFLTLFLVYFKLHWHWALLSKVHVVLSAAGIRRNTASSASPKQLLKPDMIGVRGLEAQPPSAILFQRLSFADSSVGYRIHIHGHQRLYCILDKMFVLTPSLTLPNFVRANK